MNRSQQKSRNQAEAESLSQVEEMNYIVTGTNDINVAIAKLNAEIGSFGTTQVGVINHGATEVPVVCTYYGSSSWSRLETDTEGWLFTATFSNAPDAGQGLPANPLGDIEWVGWQSMQVEHRQPSPILTDDLKQRTKWLTSLQLTHIPI